MLATKIKEEWEKNKKDYSPTEQKEATDELTAFFLELGAEGFEIDDDCPLFG